MGISANILFEMIAMYFPSVIPHKYGVVIGIAVVVISIMYSILLIGKYSLFEKILVGLSSVFSRMLITQLLIEDYRSGKLDTQSKQFRIITGIAAILAITIPVLGFNPVKGQILTQVFNVFVLPLVIIGIIFMINNKKLMPKFAAGYLLNFVLGLAFLFSVLISFNGVLALIG